MAQNSSNRGSLGYRKNVERERGIGKGKRRRKRKRRERRETG